MNTRIDMQVINGIRYRPEDAPRHAAPTPTPEAPATATTPETPATATTPETPADEPVAGVLTADEAAASTKAAKTAKTAKKEE